MEGNVVTMQDIFVFRKRGIKENGEVLGDFIPTGVRPKFAERLLVSGIHFRQTCLKLRQFAEEHLQWEY